MKNVCGFGIGSLFFITVTLWASFAAAALSPEQELGQLLYFDRYLSLNHNQACASCHDPGAGFADPLDLRLPVLYPVSVGSNTDLNGGRNAPPAAYALYSPPFSLDLATGLWTGGQFWDGRAATLADQAKGPFVNPVEMAMPNPAAVLAALIVPENQHSDLYLKLFWDVYKIDLAKLDPTDPVQVTKAYDSLAQAIGEFEKSAMFSTFSSKYDYVKATLASFTPQEAAGELLFNGVVAKCSGCHVPPLFTDFTYDNLGIPPSKNKLIKDNPPDLGLGAIINDPLQDGKFKVSSLRNVALTAPYGHNGYFATLAEIVNFYNTRDVGKWPKPEVPQNVNMTELGNLGLSPAEEASLVAFLLTLTDGYGPPLGPPTGVTIP